MGNRIYTKEIWGNPVLGDDNVIGRCTVIGHGVVIGSHCKIEDHVFIPPGVTIGDFVFIGPGVVFTNDKYPCVKPMDDNRFRRVVVNDYVSIGANCTILPGVTLGVGCFVAAHSNVTKSVPMYKKVKGNPARVYGDVKHG